MCAVGNVQGGMGSGLRAALIRWRSMPVSFSSTVTTAP